MKIIIMLITWLFGAMCGLSIASWLIASERIGDAIVFVYITNGLAIIAFLALVFLSARYRWRHRR